ncbi:MAG: hypothetical protein IPK81_09420 [Rhodospirillales bacterium]|nr:MAG: hypothetical protein IPK81_09420 [Rhodospirillales bacterium]
MADSGDETSSHGASGDLNVGGPSWTTPDVRSPLDLDDGAAGGFAPSSSSSAPPLLNPAIQRLFEGGGGSTEPPPFDLRDFAETPRVFLPIDADGSPVVERAGDRAYELALQPAGRGKGARPVRGRGGRLMVVLRDAPAGRHAVRDGATLADAMPKGVDGLLLRGWAATPREIDAAGVAALRDIVRGRAVAVMVAKPGEGHAAALLAATWWVDKAWTAGAIDEASLGLRLVSVFTDRGLAADTTVAPMAGADLFRRLVDDDDADGLVVDPHDSIHVEGAIIGRPVIAPGIAAGMLEGRDRRPGAAPLPARDTTEMEMWLESHGFPARGRRMVDAPIPDGPHLVRAVATERVAGWSMLETADGFRDLMNAGDETWSPVFVLPPPGAPRPARSAILCPGLLASTLSLGRPERPGRRLGVARIVGADDRAAAARHAAMARELLALLPPGADTMPRLACLSASGAGVLRRAPKLATRAWIEGRLRAAEADARGLVWFG